jgi:hypothetical protein
MRLELLFAAVLLASPAGFTMNLFSSSIAGVTSELQTPDRVTIPAGTRLLVRTDRLIDSSNARPGERFTGTLEANVQLDNVTVAPRGTPVHGRLIEARRAGSRSGGANLTLELTDIVINGTANPVMTESYEVRTRGRGGRTARAGIGGAGLGALMGGGVLGAAVGAGTGKALAGAGSGRQAQIGSESLLEFRLSQPASLEAAKQPAAPISSAR